MDRPTCWITGPTKFCRLWLHECTRVFSDRLVSASDETALLGILESAVKKHFQGVDNQELFADGLLFTSFMSVHGGNDKVYMAITGPDKLKKCLEEKLSEYNENFAAMELVLFGIAASHICRIARIVPESARACSYYLSYQVQEQG